MPVGVEGEQGDAFRAGNRRRAPVCPWCVGKGEHSAATNRRRLTGARADHKPVVGAMIGGHGEAVRQGGAVAARTDHEVVV